MKYLTETQAKHMNFDTTLNKMAKFMVENPQYGLFDFLYYAEDDYREKYLSWYNAEALFYRINSPCKVEMDMKCIIESLKNIDLNREYKYYIIKDSKIRIFSNDLEGIATYLDILGWNKADLENTVWKILNVIGTRESENFDLSDMIFSFQSYCDYTENEYFRKLMFEWIEKIPGTDWYLKGTKNNQKIVSNLIGLIDDMDEKYNINDYHLWDTILSKTDIEVINVIPD